MTTKQKQRSQMMNGGGGGASSGGLFKAESVKDVAESLGIVNLSEAIASALASDVEYRVHQVVDEAARFTKHARRTTLTTHDVDNALRTLNIEPLYGHTPFNPPTFRRALPFPSLSSAQGLSQQDRSSSSFGGGGSGGGERGGKGGMTGTVYFVEDEELDFDRVLREEKVALPRPTGWTAHWLAVEGVQPLIPENPPAISREGLMGKDREEVGEGNNFMASLARAGAETPQTQRNGNGTQFPPTPPSPSRPGLGHANGVNGTNGAPNANGNGTAAGKQGQLLVKQVLSRELQLYYTRLTSSLIPSSTSTSSSLSSTQVQSSTVDESKRIAALTSLRSDAGLQTLLPYLVKWVGDGVVSLLRDGGGNEGGNAGAARALEVYLEVIDALLDNQTLFVEPYLHQMLPPLLSILLHASLPLPPSPNSLSTSSPQQLQNHAAHLRTRAAATLSHLLTQHSTTYPSLAPRIMKTLLLALLSQGKSKGTREGAVRGLAGVGKEAVRKGLVEGGGARLIGSECASVSGAQESASVTAAVLDSFRTLASPSPHPRALHPSNPGDAQLMSALATVLGPYFAARVSNDAGWAKNLVEGSRPDESSDSDLIPMEM